MTRGGILTLETGERAEGDGAANDDDGERGELGGAEPGGVVLAAEAAQQVDGGGVESVGEVGGGVGGGRPPASCVRSGHWQYY